MVLSRSSLRPRFQPRIARIFTNDRGQCPTPCIRVHSRNSWSCPEVRYAPGVLLQFGAPFSARRKRSMTRKLKSLFLSFRVFRVFRGSFSVPKRARQEACRMRLVTSSPTPSFVCFARATTFLRPRRRHLIKRELILCYTHFCVFRVFCAQPIACETECPR